MKEFTNTQLSGIILAYELPFIVAGDTVSSTVDISPIGIDENGIVYEASVDINVIKKTPVDHIIVSINLTY